MYLRLIWIGKSARYGIKIVEFFVSFGLTWVRAIYENLKAGFSSTHARCRIKIVFSSCFCNCAGIKEQGC